MTDARKRVHICQTNGGQQGAGIGQFIFNAWNGFALQKIAQVFGCVMRAESVFSRLGKSVFDIA
jgi:hypothetical protein